MASMHVNSSLSSMLNDHSLKQTMAKKTMFSFFRFFKLSKNIHRNVEMLTAEKFIEIVFFLLSSLPAFAATCSSANKKKVDRVSSVGYYYLFLYTKMNDRKKYEYGKKSDREKKNETNFFSVCYRSAQFDFFHIYIY